MKAFTITSILAAACLFPSYSPAGAAAENKIQAASMQTAAGIPKQDPQLIKGKLANGLTQGPVQHPPARQHGFPE